MQTVIVTPVKGFKVRDPQNNFQPIEGPTEVPRDAFWMKRIQTGDVTAKTKAKAKK
ncbi:MAG: DUF2635 domain-containing protein [Planctomycetes bacterium]|nr:DUF2635 domain-containing protein [Planctomycetota bacterium]